MHVWLAYPLFFPLLETVRHVGRYTYVGECARKVVTLIWTGNGMAKSESALEVVTLPAVAVQSVGRVASVSRKPLAFRRIIREATLMWVVSRIFIATFTYFALLLKPSHLTLLNYKHGYQTITLRALLAAWGQWDAKWYIGVAQSGYSEWKATAFFPLYPSLIHGLTFIIGPHWLLAALIISNVAELGGFIGLGLLAALEIGDSEAAQRVIRIFAAYPLAFFLSAPYTESLFVASATLALFFTRYRWWRWAALAALFAAYSRPTGLLLCPVIFWEFGRQEGWWQPLLDALPRLVGRRIEAARVSVAQGIAGLFTALRRSATQPRTVINFALSVGAGPAALASYMAFLYVRFHHPLVFLHVQTYYWTRRNIPLWRGIPMIIKQFINLPNLSFWQARDLIDVAPVLLCIVVLFLTLRSQPFSFTIYTAGLLYLTLGAPAMAPYPVMLNSAGRFMLGAFPMFLALSRWTRGRPALDLLLVGGGFMLQGVLALFFLSGGWLV